MIRIDHVFVCVHGPRAHVDAVSLAGLTEGSGNVHPGQGTANARFFFRDSFLEILWENDAAEIESEAVVPTRLADRCRGQACPFGVALRGLPEAEAAWRYAAPFLRGGRASEGVQTIPVWSERGSAGPFVFGIGSLPGAHQPKPEPRSPQSIVGVEIHGPFDPPPGLPPGPLTFQASDQMRMRMCLGGPLPRPVSLPPELALEIVW